MHIIHCNTGHTVNVPLWECRGQQVILATVGTSPTCQGSCYSALVPIQEQESSGHTFQIIFKKTGQCIFYVDALTF